MSYQSQILECGKEYPDRMSTPSMTTEPGTWIPRHSRGSKGGSGRGSSESSSSLCLSVAAGAAVLPSSIIVRAPPSEAQYAPALFFFFGDIRFHARTGVNPCVYSTYLCRVVPMFHVVCVMSTTHASSRILVLLNSRVPFLRQTTSCAAMRKR